MREDRAIDFSDIPEITDFSKARKNPYYERIMKYGFSITEHYSPEDVKEMVKGVCTRKIDIMTVDPEEQKAFERYKKAHGYTD
jgi:hypothetical protein